MHACFERHPKLASRRRAPLHHSLAPLPYPLVPFEEWQVGTEVKDVTTAVSISLCLSFSVSHGKKYCLRRGSTANEMTSKLRAPLAMYLFCCTANTYPSKTEWTSGRVAGAKHAVRKRTSGSPTTPKLLVARKYRGRLAAQGLSLLP